MIFTKIPDNLTHIEKWFTGQFINSLLELPIVSAILWNISKPEARSSRYRIERHSHSKSNDVVKVNAGAKHITFERNIELPR
ncbi:MAG: hypothetical protein ACI845_003051 [Gammaproteobacteria bacterium]|jgi:hypothetical protein